MPKVKKKVFEQKPFYNKHSSWINLNKISKKIKFLITFYIMIKSFGPNLLVKESVDCILNLLLLNFLMLLSKSNWRLWLHIKWKSLSIDDGCVWDGNIDGGGVKKTWLKIRLFKSHIGQLFISYAYLPFFLWVFI